MLSHFHYGWNPQWTSSCSFFCATSVAFLTKPCFLATLLIDIFWLFSKLQHMRSICDNLFDLQGYSKLPQKCWRHSHNKRKCPKVIFTKHFLTKATIFRCFDVCSVQPPQIPSSNENINNMNTVSRLSFRFLWICMGHCCVMWPLLNPYRLYEKIFSRNSDICLNMHLSYNFSKTGNILTGL